MTAKYGEQIRKMRKAHGLTQQEFAEKSGISMMSLRRYEMGEREPTMSVIERMAAALALTLDDFLWSDPSKSVFRPWRFDLGHKLMQVGYSIGGNEDGYQWINYPNGTLEVSDEDLITLHEVTNSFMRFQLEELRRKNAGRFAYNDKEGS